MTGVFIWRFRYLQEREKGTYELKATQFGMDAFMDGVQAHQQGEGEGGGGEEGETVQLTATDSSVEVEANP